MERIDRTNVEESRKYDQYFYVLCYYEHNNKIAAANLWANGIRILKGAYIFKNWSKLKETSKFNLNEIFPYLNENIIDKTRIIICFENFMKGQLLLNKYLVHNLTNKHSSLRNVQRCKPISLDQVVNENTFINLDVKQLNEFDWKETTIHFSWMLSEEYQNIINIPKDILSTLEDINMKRNHLHFMKNDSFSWSDNLEKQYKAILDFVDDIIFPSLRRLESNLDSIRTKMEEE